MTKTPVAKHHTDEVARIKAAWRDLGIKDLDGRAARKTGSQKEQPNLGSHFTPLSRFDPYHTGLPCQLLLRRIKNRQVCRRDLIGVSTEGKGFVGPLDGAHIINSDKPLSQKARTGWMPKQQI